ncbi:MAG TPA: aldehyde dehydrogenase (NADP(+)) [Lacipirellulaceae bacterium]|nr:aldehyde dehydrogenase (NADP(+)) [Lacipirellulaceae bacterium]
MKHELCGRQLIDGCWTSAGNETFDATNPANGEKLVPHFAEATSGEVSAALAAAHDAFLAVREFDPRWPADLLDATATQIEALGDELLVRGELETALPRARLTGERARTCGQLRMFAKIVREGSWVEAVIDLADPKREPLPKPDLRRMFVPRGPVVVFGASNFPFAFGACGGDTASAVAAGNPVVIKGHPSHPGTSELFAAAVAAAVRECKLPAGMFALLQGCRHELSAQLVQHPQTQAVGFTGSLRAGRTLFDLASRRESPIPVYAEMGSVNPVVILPAAIKERADSIAKDLAASALLGGGQFCTKPGVVLLVGDAERRLIQALTQIVQAAPQVTMLNGPLRDSFTARTASLSKLNGVKSVVSGNASGAAGMSPSLFETTADTFLREPSLHEEAFGPGVIAVECESDEQALACVRSLGGNLTGTVHVGNGEDQSRAARVVRALEANVGRVIVNGYPTGVEVGNAIVHGGPYPATTDAGTTSVGSAAIRRFVRPVAYQNMPQNLLPLALRDDNPLGISRLVDGEWTARAIESQAQ